MELLDLVQHTDFVLSLRHKSIPGSNMDPPESTHSFLDNFDGLFRLFLLCNFEATFLNG